MTPGTESGVPRKRRKVAESCKLCRAKKTRCDGLRPVCSPCVEKHAVCEYNDTTVAITAGSLSDIQERLRQLEQRAFVTPSHTSTVGHYATENSRERPFVEHQTTYFIQQITRSAGSASAIISQAEQYEPIETDFGSIVMPPRAVADGLVYCFETYVYPLFPVLHMTSFHQRYDRLWEVNSQSSLQNLAAEVRFHAVLNIVFALGSLNNSSIEPHLKLRTADTFYQRVRKLMPLDALDVPSFEAVQCLILTTIYLTYTKYSYRCSNTLALATRTTLALGQLMRVDQNMGSQLNREMYRRAWHHCLLLERLVSALFGRTFILGLDKTIPLPQAIDDEYLTEHGDGQQPPSIPSIIDAFLASAKINEVLDGARTVDGESINTDFGLHELAETLKLNEKLDTIEQGLPHRLRPNLTKEIVTPRDQMFKMQAEAVMVRIFNVRLVLLRPYLLASARKYFSMPTSRPTLSSAEATLQRAVANLSLQTSVTAINMLHENLASDYRVMSSTVVFLVISAATVIIAASLVPDIGVDIQPCDDYYCPMISKAFQVLEGHQWQIDGARGAKRQLENFLETVKAAKEARNRSSTDLSVNDGVLPFESEQLLPRAVETQGVNLGDLLWNFQWVDANSLWTDNPTI